MFNVTEIMWVYGGKEQQTIEHNDPAAILAQALACEGSWIVEIKKKFFLHEIKFICEQVNLNKILNHQDNSLPKKN